MSEAEASGRLDRGDGVELAWARLPGGGPGVIFLPGLRSDMQGEKALRLRQHCAEGGQALLRFDYSGHGTSGGRFEDGTISAWLADALRVIDGLTQGPLVLVGSSMGGWIAVLTALARPGRVAGLVGVAAAPDFTESLIWQPMAPAQRARLLEEGILHAPSRYGEPLPITRALIEDGRRHLLLHSPIPLTCPVRLLHGERDPDVPWQTSLRLAERITGDDVRVVLIKDGDHRLSRPQDVELLARTVGALGGEVAAPGGLRSAIIGP